MDLPLASLDQLYPVSHGMQRQFEEDGYLILREACSLRDARHYMPSVRDAAIRAAAREPETHPQSGVLRAPRLVERDQEAADLAQAKRFAQIACELMGAEAVALEESLAVMDGPGSPGDPWRQECEDGRPRRAFLWLALTPITADMMALKFAKASHRGGVCQISEDADAERELCMLIVERRLTIHQIQELAPGDALFVHGWTLHGAPPNRTDRLRLAVKLVYRACEPGPDALFTRPQEGR